MFYDHLHLKLISLKNHGQCKLCRILGGLRNFCPEEIIMYPIISLIFTIMRLCAHMFYMLVPIQKWFGLVDKFGRRQPSLIFTFIASPPKQMEEFCRNLAYEFLSMSRYVRPKMISVCQKNLINLFIALSCQEFGYTILFMTKNIRMSTGHELISIFICLLKVLSFQKVSFLFL